MKLKLGFIFGLTLSYFQAFAQPIARVENVKIQSTALNQEREILIYTPIDYDWRTNEYFNVIYVFDSQNREFFDYTSSIISFLTNGDKPFMVVGITSPYNEKIDYSRNNDLLPILETEKSRNRYGKYHGNADDFLKYVSHEVVPYINANYRTLDHNTAVGHSLSASFILYSLIKDPSLFSNYIAISPNLAYDDEVLAKQLVGFDYSVVKEVKYLFLSHANEGIEYWQEWKPAREKVYAFFSEGFDNQKVSVNISSYPENNHWNTFPVALKDAVEYFFENISGAQGSQLSDEMTEVNIRINVQNENDTIYISGNQPNLGDWDPGKIQMEKISGFERAINLKIKSPAMFKFTKGTWDTALQIVGTYDHVIIKPKTKTEYEFEMVKITDQDH